MSDPVRLHVVVAPVVARTPLLDAQVTAGEAFRVVLFECLAHAAANVRPVVENRHIEALHQLRVGLRRLRTAFSTFDSGSPLLTELNARARTFINFAGSARDLDVFLDELLPPAVSGIESQHGVSVLRARAVRARERACTAVIEQLAGAEFARFQDDVAAVAQSEQWYGDAPLGDVVPALLDRHLAKARKRGKHLKRLQPHERHRLRIALKKLRYASEFFAPLYKTKKVRGFLEPLKELQDMLGHLNDVAQVRTVLGRLMIEEAGTAELQADLSHAAGVIQGWHQARADAVAAKAFKRWKKFQDIAPYWG